MWGVSFPWLSPLCFSREPWSHVVASPGRGSIRTSQCLYNLNSKVCQKPHHSSCCVCSLLTCHWFISCFPSSCLDPLIAVFHKGQTSFGGCLSSGFRCSVSGVLRHCHWKKTSLSAVDLKKNHTVRCKTWPSTTFQCRGRREERKWSWEGGVQQPKHPLSFLPVFKHFLLFFSTDINGVKCTASTKWQFGVFWGKIFCWKFLIRLSPSWDVDTWLELVLLCTSHSHTI